MKTRYVNCKTPDGTSSEFFVEDGRFSDPGDAGQTCDLEGAIVAPGFVDAHCHIIPMGLDLQKLHLGGCGSRSEILEAVRDWSESHSEGWIMAVHYDQTKFVDTVHLSREELDSVVPDRPVLLRHSNGHASVANSKALEAAKVDESIIDPAGGSFLRDSSGRLNGVLLERAHEHVSGAAPEPTIDEMTDAVMRAGDKMSALGVTCASDMMTGRWNLEKELLAYHLASQKGCKVRLRLYAQWGSMFGPRRLSSERIKELGDDMDLSLCRLAGVKIFADGAIGSATAAIYGQFLTTSGDGQLIYSPEKFKQMVKTADESNWQIAVHTIGDRSTDLVMDAYEQTNDPTRHRIEHAMILSDDQIARLAKLGSFVTMQPEFMMRFGHSYKKQLGEYRASQIKRCRSVIDAGIKLSFSSDRPIVPGDPWDGIDSAINRPDGFDPRENVTLGEAWRLYTSESARANGDAGLMGSLDVGDLADFQLYNDFRKGGLRAVYKSGEQVY